jgi:hypothetical protein
MKWRLRTLLAAMLLSVLASLQPAAFARQSPSLLEIPVQLDLAPAFDAAEQLVPRQTGGPGWEDWHGFKVRHQAWRGPLLMELRGDVLLVQAHVRYRAQGRKGLIGNLAVSTGCGIDEPPRQALIGVAIRLSLGPDWSLHPRFHLLPTRFIDRCQITALDIDVSPLVERAFQKRLRQALTDALLEMGPKLDALRLAAERGWGALQARRQLAPDLWFSARPVALAVSPMMGQGRTLSTTIGIALWPLLGSTPPAADVSRPLPPLTLFRPSQSSLRFDLAMAVSLTDLSAAVQRSLAEQSIVVGDLRLLVEEAELALAGDRLVLRAKIGGDIPGLLDVRGRPAVDPLSGSIGFAALDFAFDSTHPDAELILALFYERIRERLQQLADDALRAQLDAAVTALQAQLDGWLDGHGRVDFSDVALTALELELTEQRIGLRGQASGKVQVVIE